MLLFKYYEDFFLKYSFLCFNVCAILFSIFLNFFFSTNFVILRETKPLIVLKYLFPSFNYFQIIFLNQILFLCNFLIDLWLCLFKLLFSLMLKYYFFFFLSLLLVDLFKNVFFLDIFVLKSCHSLKNFAID